MYMLAEQVEMGLQTAFEVADGGTDCHWPAEQGMAFMHWRSDVTVGATIWYWLTPQTVRAWHE